MTETLIKYRQVRTLSQVLSVSVNYLFSNFKSIFKCMLLYVMPFFLASTLSSYYFNSSDVSIQSLGLMISNIKDGDPVEFISILAIYFFGLTLQNQILNKHIILNDESPEGRPVQAQDFRSIVIDDFKQHLPNFFFLVLSVVLCVFLLGVTLGAVLEQGLNFNFTDDLANSIIQIITLLFMAGIIIPLGVYFIYAALFISLRDKIGIFKAFARAWYYSKDKLLVTWGTSLTALMICFILNLLLKLPVSILVLTSNFFRTGYDLFGQTLYIFISITTTFFSLFISGLFMFISIFHFASLEEQREGINIQNKINNI